MPVRMKNRYKNRLNKLNNEWVHGIITDISGEVAGLILNKS